MKYVSASGVVHGKKIYWRSGPSSSRQYDMFCWNIVFFYTYWEVEKSYFRIFMNFRIFPLPQVAPRGGVHQVEPDPL